MAQTDHPCLRQPDDKTLRLWRYMDFTKFVALISTQKLFFCRLDLFEDPFEGSYSRANIALRPIVYKDWPKDRLEKFTPVMSDIAKWLREWTFVNCWHANEFESDAMWRLYARDEKAVAIETNYDTLSNILPENVFLGLVNYIDYDTQWLPEGNSLYPVMHKRKSFEYEREVRAVIQNIPIDGNNARTGLRNDDVGLYLDIDVEKLARYVYVSPSSPEWFRELTEQMTKKFGLSCEVVKSNLYSKPVY